MAEVWRKLKGPTWLGFCTWPILGVMCTVPVFPTVCQDPAQNVVPPAPETIDLTNQDIDV